MYFYLNDIQYKNTTGGNCVIIGVQTELKKNIRGSISLSDY